MSVTLLASQCPPPQRQQAFASISNAGKAPVSDNLAAGDTLALLVKWNKNATRADLLGSYGGGAYFIALGLALTAGVGLSVTLSPGTAIINGPVNLETATSLPVPASASRVWIWLGQSGILAYTVNLNPPVGAACLLGSCVTSATAVTSVDMSGVLFGGGIIVRRTADAAAPTDTPPANLFFFTITKGGAYLWDGQQYRAGGTAAGGGSGGGLTFRGAHNPATAYILGDIVLAAGGALYEVSAPVTGTAPPAAPWSLFLPAGQPGKDGHDGQPGAPGPQGSSVYNPRGAWSALASYAIADAVFDASGAYVAILASQGVGLSDGGHWKQILPPGPAGAQGPSVFTPRGDYSATTTYAVNDLVRSSGGSYLAVTASTGALVTDTAHWYCLVPAAPQGPAGPKGDAGQQGVSGPSPVFYGTFAS